MIEFHDSDCLEWMQHQPADRFDLVFGSPPYCDARTYGIDGRRGCIEWVEWMLEVSIEAARVCKGPVLWVAASVTRKRCYWPAVEGLMWEWWKRGGEHQLYRPCVFYRVGIPGSGGDDWFRADWEYVVCLKRPGKLPWSDNTAMGKPCKCRGGGAMGNRKANGERKRNERFSPPEKANPGNVIRLKVGGGHMGHPLAHENEAPMPEGLAEFFIRSCCPPDGWCLDPFSGSGTTAAVCERLGRNCVGIDVRRSQVELSRRRCAEVQRQFV